MVSTKKFFLLVVCFVARAESNSGSCKPGFKEFSNEMDREMSRLQTHIQSMTPVLKGFMWNTFELEYQVKEMRERLAYLEKANEPSPAVSEPEPARKVVDWNMSSFFVLPGQSSVGPIGGKLNSLLTESNSNASENLPFEASSK